MKILAQRNATRDLGITFNERAGLEFTVFAEAHCASKETERRSILGVAAWLGGGGCGVCE